MKVESLAQLLRGIYLAALGLIINRLRRCWQQIVEMMRSAISTYYAVYFDDVASAVAYCRSLVAFIVPRGRVVVDETQRPVVWFHVPRRCADSTQKECYLFASEGALLAAGRAGLDAPLSGHVPRSALPHDAVLLFGEDGPEAASPSRFVARRALPPAPSARRAVTPRAARAPVEHLLIKP